MMHALLLDHGYRQHAPTSTRLRREYYHVETPAVAVVERIGNPSLPVAVTVYAEQFEKPLGTFARPETLRDLLERGIA